MGYTKDFYHFELIDIPETIKATPAFAGSKVFNKSLELGLYKETRNGFVIVSAEVENDSLCKAAINIVRESIVAYFQKRSHLKPIEAVKESILFANKQLYLEATQNSNLIGKQMSCLVVLIRDKQVFYAYTGTNNLFFKEDGKLVRITPGKSRNEGDDYSDTSYINSSIYKPNMKISVCKFPFSPDTGDYIFICSDAYVRESDALITETVTLRKPIQEISIDLAKQALLDNNQDLKMTFLLLRFDIKGGKYTLAGSFEFLYANLISKIIAFITSIPALIVMGLAIILLLIYLLY